MADGAAAAGLPCEVGALRSPCCVVDLPVCRANAAAMLANASKHGLALRPHVKTHKTVEAALLQTGGRRAGIVASTMEEVAFFAGHGFADILLASLVLESNAARLAAFHTSIKDFHVMIDSAEGLATLEAHAVEGQPWSVWIIVDCGYHRAGVDPESAAALELAGAVHQSKHTALFGVYTHNGGSYKCRGVAEIKQFAAAERDAVVAYAQRIKEATGMAVAHVATGSTPTCSHLADSMAGVTEIHPGNYICYDTMQATIGSCGAQDIAMKVLCRVASAYPHRNELVLDCGWTGIGAQGQPSDYWIQGHDNLRIRSISQETCVVESKSGEPICGEFPRGTVLYVLPYHSCAMAQMHSFLLAVEDGKAVERWECVPLAQ